MAFPDPRARVGCWISLLIGWLGFAGPTVTLATVDPAAMAAELAAFGPRQVGSAGYAPSQRWLLSTLRAIGLDRVEAVADPAAGQWLHLSGEIHAGAATVIEVTAHYDTTAESVGLLDNASGCAVSVSAVADVAAAASTHSLRLVLTDREESAAQGSHEWLTQCPQAELRKIVADVNLDMVGDRLSGPGVLHLARRRGSRGLSLTPAWLVEVVLEAAADSSLPLVVLDRRWSLFSQLALRLATPVRMSDASSYLSAGVPSLTLSDLALTSSRRGNELATPDTLQLEPARLVAWTGLVTSVIRRLDGIERPPPAETEYLVVAGSVLERRDLLWIGFGLWVLLVWAGLPGRWRQSSVTSRRRQGRAYLPGFAYRMVFLVTLFLWPTMAVVLLCPTAVCVLVGARGGHPWRRFWCVLGVAPSLLFALWLAVALAAGWLVLLPTALFPGLLLLLTLATFCSWQLDPGR